MKRILVLAILAGLSGALHSGEGDPADLSFRLGSGETVRYGWTINSGSKSSGRELGKPFVLVNEKTFAMTVVLRGMARPKGETVPVSIKLQDFVFTDKNQISSKDDKTGELKEEAKTDVLVSRSKVKYVENGKVVVDSENDIGLEQLEALQRQVKAMESGEMRTTLDASGKQSEIQGDSALVETLKSSSQGIFPILAGKETKPGESWIDVMKLPTLGIFTLAKPAVVTSRMTFVKWQEKDGRRLAYIEIASAWAKEDLKGENSEGLLVEITRVDGRSTGTCLFDPATGRFEEGAIDVSVKYRIDGERDGQTTGLDVEGKTTFTFAIKRDK